jgi:heavy metal sensor kinase
MTLTTRLSVFFLGALALVLVGFSVTLYSLAHMYLYRQVDERLNAALNTLAAAAEVGAEGVEWEPHERQLALGAEGAAEPLFWTVRDPDGQLVPQAPILVADDFLAKASPELVSGQPRQEVVSYQGQSWRLWQRRVQPGDLAGQATAEPADNHDAGQPHKKNPALVLTAAASLEPVAAKLRTLALVLCGLSLSLWAVAALLGRRLSRRALVPVTDMASAARAISAANLEQRLPSPGTADELDDLGKAFNGLLGRLQDSFERQRRFTGDASHQLRTPLAALLGQVEVALRRDRTTEEYRHVLERVKDQAVGMRQIIEMLLFLARADAESQPPQLETLGLSAWLDEYMVRWSTHPRASDLHMECPPEDRCLVEAHGPLLGQLVDNLLENACKYSNPGTPIILRVRSENGAVALSMEDAGRGISPQDLPHIFEPFYRSPQARRRGIAGVGLGLAVASRIAAALGGSLRAESQEGRGTLMTLRLRCTSNGSVAGAMESQPLHQAAGEPQANV